MLVLSREMQVRIRDEVRLSPLAEGEVRRLTGLGEMYVSLKNTEVETTTTYTHLFDLAIDDIPHCFYRG